MKQSRKTDRRQRDPAKHALWNRRWEKNHPEWVKARNKKNRAYYREWERKKRATCIIYKLKKTIIRRLSLFIKRSGITKKERTMAIIGCTPEFLRSYIEAKFLPGMTWANHGLLGWHIDHIIPLATAKTPDDLIRLSHYTNLQPLWAKDNQSKRDKIQ